MCWEAAPLTGRFAGRAGIPKLAEGWIAGPYYFSACHPSVGSGGGERVCLVLSNGLGVSGCQPDSSG